MSDLHSHEDDAVLYVLGRLDASQRREFELRMAQSPELRALVSELEEGAVALTATVPRRRVPSRVWNSIEKAIGIEARPKLFDAGFWMGWLRPGWVVAAACLVGWLFYAVWIHQGYPTGARGVAVLRPAAESLGAQSDTMVSNRATAGLLPANLTAATTEIVTLKLRLAGMSNQIHQLSQMLAQQQTLLVDSSRLNAGMSNHVHELTQTLKQQEALLADSSRIKFFQLQPGSGGNTNAAQLSPGLQRALFLAMAKELGWLPPTGNGAQNPGTNTVPASAGGVDFADLRPATNSVATTSPQTQVSTTPSDSGSSAADSGTTNTMAGFVSGGNLFLAVDSSVAPAGSALTFWMGNAGESYQSLGTAVLGNNPLVVAIPFSSLTDPGTVIGISATTPMGSSNTIGVFPAPNTTHP